MCTDGRRLRGGLVALGLSMVACTGDAASGRDEALVAVRWTDSDIELVALGRDGAADAGRRLFASNTNRALERWGLGLRGEFTCTYAKDRRVRVFEASTATLTSVSAPIEDIDIEACTVDASGSPLVISTFGQRVRTYEVSGRSLIQARDEVFDTGVMLTGPDFLQTPQVGRDVLVGSAFGRVELWRSGTEWRRLDAWTTDDRLGMPSMGSSRILVPLSNRPGVQVLEVQNDEIRAREIISFSEDVHFVAVASDDRIAWVWSPQSLFVIDISTGEITSRVERANCPLQRADVLSHENGYELIGRSAENGSAVVRCETTEDGAILTTQPLRTSRSEDAIVGVQARRSPRDDGE